MKRKSVPYSVRVCPEAANACAEYVNRYDLNATWTKHDHDSHTMFSGSSAAISRIASFEDGYMAAKNEKARS